MGFFMAFGWILFAKLDSNRQLSRVYGRFESFLLDETNDLHL